MTRFDLQPFFRSTVGFDQLTEIFDSLTEDTRKLNHYPPYNIEKFNDDRYRITVAVAGFKEDDLEITKHNNLLTVEGRMANKPEKNVTECIYLYKGIAERSFQLQFRIADHMLIDDVTLENGMLHILMHREIPEELKPQKLSIKAINQMKSSKSASTSPVIEG